MSTDVIEARLVILRVFEGRSTLHFFIPRLPMSLIIFPEMEQGKEIGNMNHKEIQGYHF